MRTCYFVVLLRLANPSKQNLNKMSLLDAFRVVVVVFFGMIAILNN